MWPMKQHAVHFIASKPHQMISNNKVQIKKTQNDIGPTSAMCFLQQATKHMAILKVV